MELPSTACGKLRIALILTAKMMTFKSSLIINPLVNHLNLLLVWGHVATLPRIFFMFGRIGKVPPRPAVCLLSNRALICSNIFVLFRHIMNLADVILVEQLPFRLGSSSHSFPITHPNSRLSPNSQYRY